MNKTLRSVVAAVSLLALATASFAQGVVQLPAGNVLGNPTAARAPGAPATVTSIIDRAISSTRGVLLTRQTAVWAGLTPGTVGLPLVSGGAGADLGYSVLGIAGGGSNCSAASGTCLDNISGFSSTGFLTRTGAGTYAFQSATNGIVLGNLAQIATNSILANITSGTANVAAFSMPSCSTAASALKWTTNTGVGCNSSITAAAVPASGLTGATLAAGVTASSLTSLGTLTSLTSGAATFSSTITAASLSTVGTIGGSLCATAGGLVLYESGINCFAASAASVTVGTTTVASGTTTRILYNNAGVLGEYTISGTGTVVCMVTSCTMVTPTLGVATATSINKVAITAPATSATLTIADGKTLTASNSIALAGTDSTTMTFPSVSATITRTVASGAKALATGAIASAACTSAQTDTATGTASTDAIVASFNGDPTAVTGYVPLTTGMLTIIAYPTADTVNFKVCNNTSASITPGAITINWRVVR